jgi:hypothetical protein
MPLPSAGITGAGREGKATVTGRISGRSLALSGGPSLGDRMPIEQHTNFLQVRAGHGYTARLQAVRDDLSRCVPGRANREKFCAKTFFRKSDSAPPLLSPCARRRLISSHVDGYMVKNTMTPTTKTDVTFEHIGAARLYNGSVRIDVKTMQAVIPAGEVRRLEERWPAPVYDISDVMKNSDAAPVGKAWITRSGKAVMISINDVQYVSPLAQVKGMLKGERKYANVSTMHKVQPFATNTHQTEAAA